MTLNAELVASALESTGRGGSIITLLTDFGGADYFVGAVKGVILSINPQVRIVDLTHEIPAHDIAAAGFILWASCGYYPPRTIHMAVVDPGVGSECRRIVVETPDALFVGPDNGLFTQVYDTAPEFRVFNIGESWRAQYLRHAISPTFHGRDIFAPVAAWLSRGLSPVELGEPVKDPVRFDTPGLPSVSPAGSLSGSILHIDRYGNCVTSIGLDRLLPVKAAERGFLVAGWHITRICRFFSEAEGTTAPFAYPGSAGLWEIAIWQDSAANQLGIGRGTSVSVPGELAGGEETGVSR